MCCMIYTYRIGGKSMKDFIDVRRITKQYETAKALNNVSLTIPKCSLTAIVGKSGCGKAGSHKEVYL